MSKIKRIAAVLAVVAMLLSIFVPSVGAQGSTATAAYQSVQDTDFPSAPFAATWSRTDLPVQEQKVSRTWMWGPTLNHSISEQYAEAPGGQRQVVYLDKTRMEDNTYRQSNAPWYITNGLLAKELMTGQEQVGDNQFLCFEPANVFAVGDDNPQNPTYAEFGKLMDYKPLPNGWKIDQQLQTNGSVFDNAAFIQYDVKSLNVGAPTNHDVASVFWNFMNSSGLVYNYGSNTEQQGKLFQNPFYATGYPLTEAYWANVFVAGKERVVLTQVFERRVLTYTPGNPQGWKVEAGNVGLQYYKWRYQGGQVSCQQGSTPPPPSCNINCGSSTPPVQQPTDLGTCTLPGAGDVNGMKTYPIESAPQGTWFHRNVKGDVNDSWFVSLALGPYSGGSWISEGNPGQIVFRQNQTDAKFCLGVHTQSSAVINGVKTDLKSQFMGTDSGSAMINVQVTPGAYVAIWSTQKMVAKGKNCSQNGDVVMCQTSDRGDLMVVLPDNGTVVMWTCFTTHDHTTDNTIHWGPNDRNDSGEQDFDVVYANN